MKRQIIKIDEDKCTGCGLCIPNCHEGALQIIDDNARLISDLMCDGLGACIGYCPEDAITLEEREAEPYNEIKVISEMVNKGSNTVIAHLKHLKDHNEQEFLRQGIDFLQNNELKINFSVHELIEKLNCNNMETKQFRSMSGNHEEDHHHGMGCPGSGEMNFSPKSATNENLSQGTEIQSQLSQWPIQMHLINPTASYFQNSDVVLAADCVAYAIGNFHSKYLKGKSLAIACPKLDVNKEIYVKKITSLIDNANVNTISVMIMEVPCCGGLVQMVETARSNASRKVPVKVITVGIQGEILADEWI